MWEVRVSPSGEFSNHPFESRHFTAIPLTSAIGAEITGIRLPDLSEEAFEDFRQALYHHKMLFLRDQHLDHAEHEAFAARFGPFAVDAYTQGVPGHRDVHPIVKEAETSSKALFGGGWHTDSPFLAEPPSITTLRSVEVPPYGGDTVWANCALALRHLSRAYRDMLRPLRVHMSAANNYATQEKLLGKAISFADPERYEEGIRGHYHPLIRTHPETGEESLYVDENYAVGIEGMTSFEAKPILDFLVHHITQHGFTCRLRWEPGMVAMWDNRLTLHLGPNDYDGFRREMYRTTSAGSVPA
ncbi:taurine dioxygenase [Altererythrobacter atlanticus]|uniref:Alpha-ketoglutarate-dependent taurine dioxygenase n=1 Tax=Croceibacterium atlanticum TaxID=1267766 RepID=A0A0F7KUN7_9SPHN|nr:TauD/TfdA family dioxygenase [Croceibacterium atlanticum]AKH42962.1 Alpha-ketoglutarate-dependent taurine dioxygenase [Croceibacterium atlanticum]MBB5734081.1 taurine dioxygenase [Croceibacterium atlanticum]